MRRRVVLTILHLTLLAILARQVLAIQLPTDECNRVICPALCPPDCSNGPYAGDPAPCCANATALLYGCCQCSCVEVTCEDNQGNVCATCQEHDTCEARSRPSQCTPAEVCSTGGIP